MVMHAPAIKATELLVETPPPPEVLPCKPGVPWMLWWIVGIHVCWGLGLVVRPERIETLLILIGVDWIANIGIGPVALGGILLAVSACASTGLLFEARIEHAGRRGVWLIGALLCPQYFIVLAAFISDVSTLGAGNVRGQDVERWLLVCALAPVVWGALLHTASILERYALVWSRR
jgi:hypothetical protein